MTGTASLLCFLLDGRLATASKAALAALIESTEGAIEAASSSVAYRKADFLRECLGVECDVAPIRILEQLTDCGARRLAGLVWIFVDFYYQMLILGIRLSHALALGSWTWASKLLLEICELVSKGFAHRVSKIRQRHLM